MLPGMDEIDRPDLEVIYELNYNALVKTAAPGNDPNENGDV